MTELMNKAQAFQYAAEKIKAQFGDDLTWAAKNLKVSLKALKYALDKGDLRPEIAQKVGLAWQRVPTYVPENGDGPALDNDQFKAWIREQTESSPEMFADLAKRCQCSEKVLKSALSDKCRRIPETVVQGHGYATRSQYMYWPCPSSPGFVPAILPENYDLKSYRKLISEGEKYVLKELDEGKDFGEVAEGLNIAQDTLRKILEGQVLPSQEFCNQIGFGQTSEFRYIDQDGHVFGRATFYRRSRNYLESTYGSLSAAANGLDCTEKDLKSITSDDNPVKQKLMGLLGIEKTPMISYVPLTQLAKQSKKVPLPSKGKKQVVGYKLKSGESITPAKAGRLFRKALKKEYLTTRLAARKMGIRHEELLQMFDGQKPLNQNALQRIGASEIEKVVSRTQTKGLER